MEGDRFGSAIALVESAMLMREALMGGNLLGACLSGRKMPRLLAASANYY
jgi:hypothetical protein